jgi:hypothetical protein
MEMLRRHSMAAGVASSGRSSEHRRAALLISRRDLELEFD